MYHILAMTVNAAAPANTALVRIIDPAFDDNGTNFRFTELYKIIGALGLGATITRWRLNVPTYNSIIQHQFERLNQTATIADQAQPDDRVDDPLWIPMNEPVGYDVTGTGAAAQYTGLLWVAPRDWSPRKDLPPDPLGVMPFSPLLCIRATATPTSVANAWVNDAAITLESTPRGGWYRVEGLDAFRANGQAVRLHFRRSPKYGQRELRPGSICRESQATRQATMDRFVSRIGPLGYFHTQELPTVDILAADAAATSIELRIYCRLVSLAGQGQPPFAGY